MQTELTKCPAAQALPLYTGYLGLPRFAVWLRRPEGLVVVAGGAVLPRTGGSPWSATVRMGTAVHLHRCLTSDSRLAPVRREQLKLCW